MDPFPLIEKYGADPFRFYCLREVSFGQDGMVSEEGFAKRVEEVRKAGARYVFLKTGAYRPEVVAFTMKAASEAKIDMLTFDGAGRAGTALCYGPAFSTYNESSDLTFRDATNGLVFGGPATAGQAENLVLRCQFLRCGVGIQTVNWNSMDIWVWYCRFEDCGRGIHNVMGNWHVWQSLFLRSRKTDVGIQNLMAFSVVNNTSVGSNRFFDFSSGHSWGSPTSLTGNRRRRPPPPR